MPVMDTVAHRYRDVQRMLERQGMTFLKGPFGENIENSRPPSSKRELRGWLFSVFDTTLN